MATNDPLEDALRPLAKALVSVMRDELAKHAKGSEGPRYYDAKSAPMGKTAFLRLAAQGAFPSFKVGKKVRALASDVHAYVERQQGAKPRAPRVPFDGSSKDINEMSVDEILALPTGKGK